MHTITTFVQVVHARQTRQRTFAQLRLLSTSSLTTRLPFVIRMMLSTHEVDRPQHRHQHWCVRQQPPLLQGNFLEKRELEEGAVYEVQMIPNCTRSGLVRYAYFILDAIKLEPGLVVKDSTHTIDYVPDTILVPQYPILDGSRGWYEKTQSLDIAPRPSTPYPTATTPTTVCIDCGEPQQKEAFLSDFLMYVSSMYSDPLRSIDTPESRHPPQSARRRQHRHRSNRRRRSRRIPTQTPHVSEHEQC